MRTLALLSTVTQLVFLTAAAAAADTSIGPPQSCIRTTYVAFVVGSRLVTLQVPYDQIEQSPPWDPAGGEEPPLSVSEALRLASAELLRTVPNPKKWNLSGVNLQSLCRHRSVYEFFWQEQVAGASGTPGNLTVPVLMSGVAISTSSALAAVKQAEP